MLCGTCKTHCGSVRDYYQHIGTNECSPWRKIVELKAAGEEAAADREARKAMGVYKEMTEEDKQALKDYYELHKDEILARAKLKRDTQKRIMENLQNKSKTIKRKC